ncbi:hypothetical protein Tco_1355358 [Tanacetum coccineum]
MSTLISRKGSNPYGLAVRGQCREVDIIYLLRMARNLSHDTGKAYKEIGSGLKKHFEDGVVKREENLQPTQEVEIARHASRGNWRREKRKNKPGFKLPAYVMMSIEHGVTLKESGKTAYLFSGGFRQ